MSNDRDYYKPLARDLADIALKYHELIYAVENKVTGESRHETALRTIQGVTMPIAPRRLEETKAINEKDKRIEELEKWQIEANLTLAAAKGVLDAIVILDLPETPPPKEVTDEQ